MNKVKLSNLIRLSNYYYKLASIKYAVPLGGEDDRGGIYISPNSEYGVPNQSPFMREDPEDLERKSQSGWRSLPEYSEYKEHYAKTEKNYRIIFLKNFFGLRNKQYKINPPTVDQYKNMISQSIANPALDEDAVSEGQQLLKNFDSIFAKDAINVVVNKYSPSDQVTAEAIDHDLGHRFLDEIGKFDSVIQNRKNIKNNFEQAFKDEYQIQSFELDEDSFDNEFIDISDERKDLVINDFFDNGVLAYDLLDTIITNNRIPGSISSTNLSEDIIDDLSPDLLAIYNKNGETFEGLQFNGFDFYTNNHVSKFSLDEETFTYGYFFTPKDKNIPKINQVIQEYLAEVEKVIKTKIPDLVGKVVILWTGDEPY